MGEIYKLSETKPDFKKSGIYKINFPNGKYYIGLSVDIRKRILGHNENAYGKHKDKNLPVYNAIRKFGRIDKFEILEEISREDKTRLKERERYWISYYDATNKGYNVSIGGDYNGNPNGYNSPDASLSKEEYFKVVDLLKHSNKTLKDIAKEMGVTKNTIERINSGDSYYHSELTYPIRNPERLKEIARQSKISKNENYLTDEEVEGIIFELKNSIDNYVRIAEKFNTSKAAVCEINTGKSHFNPNIDYPIRKNKINSKKITDEKLKSIIKDLQENNLYIKEIAKKHEISTDTINRINKGEIYKQENLSYPIRKNKLNGRDKNNTNVITQENVNKAIDLLMNTNLTQTKIALECNMSKTLVYNIKNGLSYKKDDLNYPLR